MTDTTSDDVTTPTSGDDRYAVLLAALRRRYTEVAQDRPLFTTSATGLFQAFRQALPPSMQQLHDCRTCARFVETWGRLVVVRPEDGRIESILWDATEVPEVYRSAVAAVARAVASAKITGVWLSGEMIWGTPVTGVWEHFAIEPVRAHVTQQRGLRTPEQQAAEKAQDYGTLQRALAEFDAELVSRALVLLTNGALFRSEVCIGVARWLSELHAARAAIRSREARDNLTWLAVATAPPGFCHVRSTMIGTLLVDLKEGLSFEVLARRFAEKVNPGAYQRPQAPASEGNIAQAERLFAELGIAAALERRFARLDDIQALWTPRPEAAPAAPAVGAVFAHLRPKAQKPAVQDVDMPAVTMTWERFLRVVLPDAVRMEAWIKQGRQPFYALVTACDPDAPPILQWDLPERRNPVSYYTHVKGSCPEEWRLVPNTWQPVSALTYLPFMWHGEQARFSHFGDGVFFLLDGAGPIEGGAAFLPRFLRSELHEVRATMEAFAKDAAVAGREEASACGLGLRKGHAWDAKVRVTTANGQRIVYRLDRWE